MSKDKFEQLIEYVINDDEQKARELFHQIVVEKSRTIYESLMEDEDLEEAADEDLEEAADEELEEDLEDLEEGMMDEMGGDAAKGFIQDVETDEMGMPGMAEDDDEFADEEPIDGEEPEADDLEGRVANLEDELDALMAEFQDLVDGPMDGGEEPVDGGDALEVDDTESEEFTGMNENVNLKAAPAPVKSEEGNVYKKSAVAANAGAKGPIGNSVKPVHAGTNEGGHHDTAAYKNVTKDLIGKVGNTPAQGTQRPSPAPKPHLAQATGVNTKSVTR
jgi:hypothetical protein